MNRIQALLTLLATVGAGLAQTAEAPRASGAEPGPDPNQPRVTSGRLEPATALWAVHRPVGPTAAEAPGALGSPRSNPRYAPPAGPPAQVGYAPRVGPPLPGYPGIAANATGLEAYPAATSGTGPLSSLFTDLKACRPGDVITIVITQQAIAAANADKNSQRDYSLSMDGGSGVLSFLPSFSLGGSGSSKGKTNDSSSFNVSTTFTAVVTEVAPTGNLLIAGEQIVDMDGQPQWVKLCGEVRPYDVRADNTVESTKVANVHIEFVGTRSKKHRSGLLSVIGGALESLFGIFF